MHNDGLDLTERAVADLKVDLAKFRDSPLWAVFLSLLRRDQKRVFSDLVNEKTPMEILKFKQGELAQVNRDILIVERLARFLDRSGREETQ
jgi:hypothetical protein